MTDRANGHPSSERSRLRSLVATIEGELAALSASQGDATAHGTEELRVAWTELVAALALGPEPATRECPTCGRFGMRDATLCGYCWAALAPLARE